MRLNDFCIKMISQAEKQDIVPGPGPTDSVVFCASWTFNKIIQRINERRNRGWWIPEGPEGVQNMAGHKFFIRQTVCLIRSYVRSFIRCPASNQARCARAVKVMMCSGSFL